MSLARIYTTKTVRKDWTCGSCGAQIKKGVDGRISFAVVACYEQTRCMKPKCYPSRGQLESSLVATVYDAQDSIDWGSLSTMEEIQEAVNSVAEACTEVAGEYEANEMFEINEVLQERAEMLNAAASEIEGWDASDEEPQEDDFDDAEEYDTAHDEWVEATVDSAQQAVNDVELP